MGRGLMHSLVLVLVLIATAEGHVRLVCPRPMSAASNHESTSKMMDNICPPDENATVTNLEPGLFTVHFEETKFIKGSPFRILLFDNQNVEHTVVELNGTNSTQAVDEESEKLSCLLLDHIPHNDHAIISDQCYKKRNDYPLGICEDSSYYITVRIPDVSCDDCSLVLMQVDIPTEHALCNLTPTNESTGNCFIFSSCAKVRIRPSEAGTQKDLRSCSDYLTNLPGDWPYRPQDLYKTNQKAILTLDLLHKDLHVEIPKDFSLNFIKKVQIQQRDSVIWNVSVGASVENVESHFLVWRNLSDYRIQALRSYTVDHSESLSKAGELALSIFGSTGTSTSDITFVSEHFSFNKLRRLHDLYSPGGWLISHKFLGPMAEDPVAALPAGLCSPQVHVYVAYLHSVHITAHGILSMMIMENRAYITAILHEDNEEIQALRILPPELVRIGHVHINIPKPFTGVFQTAIDITDFIPYLETEKFLTLVEVKTDKEDAVMIGDLEEGIHAVLRDENGQISGMGAFQFTEGPWLRVEIVLNNLSPTIRAAHIYGLGRKMVDISRDVVHCTHKFCCLETFLSEISSELLLHLMGGQAVLHVETDAGSVSGQIMLSNKKLCEIMGALGQETCSSGQHSCDNGTMNITYGNIGIQQFSNILDNIETTSGDQTQLGTYVLDRANVLNYCVQIWNVDSVNGSFMAMLYAHQQEFHSMELLSAPGLTNSVLGCGAIFLGEISNESTKQFLLTVKNGEKTVRSHAIPKLCRPECLQSKILDVGETKAHWSRESAPLDDLHARVQDNVQFIFKDNTTLFLASNKEAFDSCDFNEAREITEVNHVHDMKSYYYLLSEPGTLYFMDESSCNSTQPLKLTVHVVSDGDMLKSRKSGELCRHSIYQAWRKWLVQDWQEPNVTSSVILGLVVGLILSLIFLAWQGFRLKIIPSSLQIM